MHSPILVTLILLLPVTYAQYFSPRVHLQWNYINYTWPSPEAYRRAVSDGSYVKEHNVVTGIKVWRDRIYLTIPRLKSGVPVTLAVVSANRTDGNVSPLLEPYPSWDMQREGDCSGFQLVQSMEIDPAGRMWVINNGRTELRTEHPKSICPSRLVIFDLESNGKVLLDYVFPEDVAVPSSVYLNDIVVDHEDGGWAYISDNDSKQPGIIVFSLCDKQSWKVSDKSMEPQREAFTVTVNGTSFLNRSPVNGIGLSQASDKYRLVYYWPLSSFDLFAVATLVLKRGTRNIANHVISYGRRPSQSAGMVASARGALFYSLLTMDAVAVWDTAWPPVTHNQRILIQDHVRSQYPDSFAIDERQRLWYVSNRLQAYRTDTVDVRQTNIRLIAAWIGDHGYQYYANGTAPQLPKIL